MRTGKFVESALSAFSFGGGVATEVIRDLKCSGPVGAGIVNITCAPVDLPDHFKCIDFAEQGGMFVGVVNCVPCELFGVVQGGLAESDVAEPSIGVTMSVFPLGFSLRG